MDPSENGPQKEEEGIQEKETQRESCNLISQIREGKKKEKAVHPTGVGRVSGHPVL